MATRGGIGSRGGGLGGSGDRRGGMLNLRRLHHHLRGNANLAGEIAADANGLFPFGDFQLGDAGLFNQFNQLLDFADIH